MTETAAPTARETTTPTAPSYVRATRNFELWSRRATWWARELEKHMASLLTGSGSVELTLMLLHSDALGLEFAQQNSVWWLERIAERSYRHGTTGQENR